MSAKFRVVMPAFLLSAAVLLTVAAMAFPAVQLPPAPAEPPDRLAVGAVPAAPRAVGSGAVPAVAGLRPLGRLHAPPVPLAAEDGPQMAPSPVDFRSAARLAANERKALGAQAPQAAVPITAAVLALPVEFGASETLEYQVQSADRTRCVTVTNTFTGPLHGEIPYPGGGPDQTLDNHTVYYSSTEPADYERLIFGRQGYTAPIRAGDPNLNDGAGVDLRGLTVESYFAAQSDDTVVITGTVAPWVAIPHSEAYFGIDTCVPNISPIAIPDQQLGSLAEMAVLAAEGVKALGGTYATYAFWERFDEDGDGVLDAVWVIHAGRGQEYGGGPQAEKSIWSRATDVRSDPAYPDGHVIHDNGTADPGDDLRLGPVTHVPEDSDIGVLIEEFGHSFFGLPDLYTMRSSNSVGWWAPMSSGIWGGELGGSRPVNMPLWFRQVADCRGQPCGWAHPTQVVSYTTAPQTVLLGQAGTPAGGIVTDGPYAGQTIHEGLRVDLPPQQEPIPNHAGTGGGAYSGAATGEEMSLWTALDLSAVAGPIQVTIDGYWRIRRFWGYAYVEISTDGREFESIPDLDGRFTADNPDGTNEGFGMTGDGSGELRFDLSSWAGQRVWLRLRYYTYQGASGTGWWVDNVVVTGLVDGAVWVVFNDRFGAGLERWSAVGWREVPTVDVFEHHYLVEWRNGNGFDEALRYATSTSFKDQDEWRVDRVPANVPGALVMYRNLKYPFSGAFVENLQDAPSIGSKYALLVVDPNFWPTRRPSGQPFSGRLESLDALLSLSSRQPFSLEVRDAATGALQSTDIITAPASAKVLNDAYGYYPGHYTDAAGKVQVWDEDASVVLPSRDGQVYSTRITQVDRSRPHPLDGTSAGGRHFYGSGNPGDSNAQLGVHIEVVDQAADGSWGAVQVYNAGLDYFWTADRPLVLPGQEVRLTARSYNFGAAPRVVRATVTLPEALELVRGEPTWEGPVPAGGEVVREIVVRASVEFVPGYLEDVIAVFEDGEGAWRRSVVVRGGLPAYLPIVLWGQLRQ